MIRLYLTRHGQTEWNKLGLLQGSKDSELTDLGIKQAKRLKERLKDEKIDIIYSSPMKRAVQTAKIIHNDVKIIIDNHLKEMHFGDWEGLPHEEIRKLSSQYDLFWTKPHLYQSSSGESYEIFKKRVLGSLRNIIHYNNDKNVLIVSHAVVTKQILNYFENRPLEKFWEPPFMESTCLSIIEIDEDNINIQLNSDISHLKAI
ncbi:histidine phosphatase family protein [Mycoplasmatota bacterium]|nr:histidine phosphatase family protein [Mycoplasmatota bacterium]